MSFKYFASATKVICLLMFVLIGTTSAQNNSRCPFNLLYHLGDGVFDNGNAIAIRSGLPASKLPYGISYTGAPTGRWSDGLLDIDYGARGLGFPEITAYLSGNMSSANAIMFAVARSPVLDRSFFTSRGIRIPSYTASIKVQTNWFKKYLKTICSNPKDCATKLGDSLFLFGDIEANDLVFPLIQGKSIKEVKSYVSYVTKAQINVAREVIKMGASRVILPGNAPIGCYPHILTELATNDKSAYDSMGCLKSVNDLIEYKNNDLRKAINNLNKEFPNTFIMYSDFYTNTVSIIRETMTSNPNGNLALQACCGIGGKYNYDGKRFCGSAKASTCSDPNQYVFWDGIHLTQEANNRLSRALSQQALGILNCTTTIIN